MVSATKKGAVYAPSLGGGKQAPATEGGFVSDNGKRGTNAHQPNPSCLACSQAAWGRTCPRGTGASTESVRFLPTAHRVTMERGTGGAAQARGALSEDGRIIYPG